MNNWKKHLGISYRGTSNSGVYVVKGILVLCYFWRLLSFLNFWILFSFFFYVQFLSLNVYNKGLIYILYYCHIMRQAPASPLTGRTSCSLLLILFHTKDTSVIIVHTHSSFSLDHLYCGHPSMYLQHSYHLMHTFHVSLQSFSPWDPIPACHSCPVFHPSTHIILSKWTSPSGPLSRLLFQVLSRMCT